ncbi:MAG: OmpL47-type beta-barrel domain-containing protein, partial [Promethearchaeota archaeon]
EGNHTVEYYCIDRVGNNESIDFEEIYLEINAPITIIQYFAEYPPSFVNASSIISFNANDGTGTGVNATYYRINGGIWINYSVPFTLNAYGEGNHTIEYFSGDNVGNNETMKTEYIYLDINLPTTTLLFTSLYTADYVNSTILFTLNADDGTGSGINSIGYQIDGGSWNVYTQPFNLSGYDEGMHWICYNSTDNIGYIEALHNKTIYLFNETTPPITNVLFDPVISPNIIYPSTPISLSANDGTGAGVAFIYYRIDSDGWNVYSAPFTLTGKAEGIHKIWFYSIDNVGNNETLTSYEVNLKFSATAPPEEPPILLIILIIIIGALSAALILVGVKKSKGGGKAPKTYVKEVKVKKTQFEATSLRHKREQLVKDAKLAEKSGDFTTAAALYGQCKEISNELFKLGIDGEAENTKVFANLESEALASRVEFKLTNSCLNGFMTQYGNFVGLIYYTEPKIYPDKTIWADGLVLNDSKFLQARLTIPNDAQELAEELAIDPANVEHIKALQFIYTSDLSEEKIIELSATYQTIDIMLFIVGLSWPTFQYEQTMNLPQDDRIDYPENIRIINHELFADLVGLEDKFRSRFDKIIELHQSFDSNALKKIHDSFKDIPHTTVDLKENLRQKGLLHKDFDDYFYF